MKNQTDNTDSRIICNNEETMYRQPNMSEMQDGPLEEFVSGLKPVENNAVADSSSSAGYPAIEDYHGGGSILNGYTSVNNVLHECRTENVDPDEVWSLLRTGHELIILKGSIKGVKKIAG